MRHSRFITSSIFISVTLHALAAFGLWWGYERSETLAITASGGAEISGMSWEVEAPVPPQPVPVAAAPAPNPPPAQPPEPEEKPEEKPEGKKDEEAVNTAALPATRTSESPTTAHSVAAGTGSGPPATEIQNYLLHIRKHLSDAIQISSISGVAPSSLILKISITRSGEVSHQEIEKSSGDPETDGKVLGAFASILPLPPFPDHWSKSSAAPHVLTVRLPIEIHSRQ